MKPEVTWFWILLREPEFKVEAKPVCLKGSHEKPHCVVELSRAVVTGVVSQINLQEILKVVARIVQGSFSTFLLGWNKNALPIDDKIMSLGGSTWKHLYGFCIPAWRHENNILWVSRPNDTTEKTEPFTNWIL